ncbi:MAG: hypothetical protein KIG25_06120 [Eubacteriales bacterium]|nr:hypothetical protein [Eubacteriales bacterium]
MVILLKISIGVGGTAAGGTAVFQQNYSTKRHALKAENAIIISIFCFLEEKKNSADED